MSKTLYFIYTITFFMIVSAIVQAQQPKVYNLQANVKKDLSWAIKQAKEENKHVLIQIGGNWCVWCLRFNELINENKSLDSLVKSNYIAVHLNYSKENKNFGELRKLGFPQRFGFPVFVILDSKGNRIHTQNSAYLESGSGHDAAKVADFLRAWTPFALHYKNYQD